MVAPNPRGSALSSGKAAGRSRGLFTRTPGVFAVHDIRAGTVKRGAVVGGAQVVAGLLSLLSGCD